jgi:hypothetical protein
MLQHAYERIVRYYMKAHKTVSLPCRSAAGAHDTHCHEHKLRYCSCPDRAYMTSKQCSKYSALPYTTLLCVRLD